MNNGILYAVGGQDAGGADVKSMESYCRARRNEERRTQKEERTKKKEERRTKKEEREHTTGLGPDTANNSFSNRKIMLF